jgi:hypothetical protein
VKGKSGFKETTETLRTFEKSISSFVQVGRLFWQILDVCVFD